MQYCYDINYNPVYVDEKMAICCRYVQRQLAFYTPCGNKMKIWSILSGEVVKVLLGITEDNSDITAFILDKLVKRMLIGDAKGCISIFNAENGAKIKSLPRHKAEVIHIMECPEAKMFVTASIDSNIHLTLDNDFGENELLRVISVKDERLTSISFYPQFNFVVAGIDNG
jgi:WD40 repeat protein